MLLVSAVGFRTGPVHQRHLAQLVERPSPGRRGIVVRVHGWRRRKKVGGGREGSSSIPQGGDIIGVGR